MPKTKARTKTAGKSQAAASNDKQERSPLIVTVPYNVLAKTDTSEGGSGKATKGLLEEERENGAMETEDITETGADTGDDTGEDTGEGTGAETVKKVNAELGGETDEHGADGADGAESSSGDAADSGSEETSETAPGPAPDESASDETVPTFDGAASGAPTGGAGEAVPGMGMEMDTGIGVGMGVSTTLPTSLPPPSIHYGPRVQPPKGKTWCDETEMWIDKPITMIPSYNLQVNICDLPMGWSASQDSTTKLWYYHNASGIVTWEKPKMPVDELILNELPVPCGAAQSDGADMDVVRSMMYKSAM